MVCTTSGSVSVSKRFFKFGNVCRMSKALRHRSAMSCEAPLSKVKIESKSEQYHIDILVQQEHRVFESVRIHTPGKQWKPTDASLGGAKYRYADVHDSHSRSHHGRYAIFDEASAPHTCYGIDQSYP